MYIIMYQGLIIIALIVTSLNIKVAVQEPVHRVDCLEAVQEPVRLASPLAYINKFKPNLLS